jgi:uncharacterized protein involved in outer membrane biogenesis
MKAKKIILTGLAVLIIVIGIILWQIFANLEAIVAGVIQNMGTEVVQTEVKVGDVGLDLKSGKASISELTIANPKGYSDPYIFSMEDIGATIDVASLGKNPIVIDEILIRQPKIFFEIDKNGESNMGVLKKNIESSSGKGADKKEKKDTGTADEAITLIIKRFRFEGGYLSALNAATPDNRIEQTLPVIHMNNLGAAKGGATGKEIAVEMMTTLVSEIAKTAIKTGVNQAMEKKREQLKEDLKNKADEALKDLLKH